MVDPRIMVAVLASMLLAATGLESDIGADNITNSLPDGVNLQEALNIGASNDSKGSSYGVSARISVNTTDSQSLGIERAEVRLGPSTLSMPSGNLTSTSPVKLNNFSGRISLSHPVTASGSVEGWNTSSVGFSGSRRLERATGSQTFSAELNSPESITVDSVSGLVNANGTETRLDEERKLEIEGFSGNISFKSQNSIITLNGSATRLKSGSLTYR
jgi:hypothetical protein